MPRTARAAKGGICYHVFSRGNNRATVFHDERDYSYFEELLARAKKRLAMRILGWCIMPNHFHLVLFPFRDGDLGRWLHWLLTSQVQRHRSKYSSIGRIWQGRFKAPPVQQDEHLLAVLRYVERNPLSGGLVSRAQDWAWSSLSRRGLNQDPILDNSPVPLLEPWVSFVNDAVTQKELSGIRKSVYSGSPYGSPAWVRGTAERLGLLSTLRPRGRPKATLR